MALDYDKDYTAILVKSIREADYLCDVTLVAGLGNRKFPVHRNVMVASNPYFKAMLGPDYEEANKKEIVLHALNGPTLNAIVNFCYSGSVRLTKKNVADVMAAASSMKFVQLEEKCANFLRLQLNVENSAKILLVADQYNLADLRNKAMRSIRENFVKVPSADMVKLDEKIFGEILKKDKIDANETDVFDCFVKWTEHDAANRSQFVAPLAESIRLGHMPTEFLNERVESFFEKHGCGKLVSDEKLKRLGVQKPICARRFQPSLFFADFDGRSGEINIFDCTNGDYEEFKTISIEKPRKNGVFSARKFYMFNDDNDADSDLDSYDLISSEKEIMPDLPINLCSGSLISIEQYTYVLGRHRQALDDVAFTRCYRFDSERKVWEARESIPCSMNDLSAVELDGLIYVAGTIKRTQKNASNFWCYDPYRNIWTEKAHPNFNKGEIELVKVKEKICIGNTAARLIRYDVARNRWTKVNFKPPVPYKRQKADYTYVWYDAIDLEKSSYGLVHIGDGTIFVGISMDGNRCSFDDPDDYYCCLEFHLNVSDGRKHLFIH